MIVRPCGISVARVGVARLHRHLPKAPRSGLAAFELVTAGWPIGWAMVGRPGAPVLQALGWVEVTRVAVPSVDQGGPWGGCSALYRAAAAWAWERGWPILTYTLSGEGGQPSGARGGSRSAAPRRDPPGGRGRARGASARRVRRTTSGRSGGSPASSTARWSRPSRVRAW